MQPVILIFLGAGLGGVLRHAVNILAARGLGAALRNGTAIINISGSFIMGVLMGRLTFRAGADGLSTSACSSPPACWAAIRRFRLSRWRPCC